MWESRPPNWDDDTDEAFFEELRHTSKSAVLVLMEDFNLLDVNWDHYTAGRNRSRRFLKHIDDYFIIQLLRKRT